LTFTFHPFSPQAKNGKIIFGLWFHITDVITRVKF